MKKYKIGQITDKVKVSGQSLSMKRRIALTNLTMTLRILVAACQHCKESDYLTG